MSQGRAPAYRNSREEDGAARRRAHPRSRKHLTQTQERHIRIFNGFTLGRKLIVFFLRINYYICISSKINLRNLGPDLSKLSISDDKYNSSVSQDMIDVTGRKSIPSLLAASYASSSWKKLNSALHSIKEYNTLNGGGKIWNGLFKAKQ